MAAVAPRCRPVGSVVVAVADVDPLPAECSLPPLVAINVAVIVEAGDRPAGTVPRGVVSTVSAAGDIASTATAISETGAPVATGGPRASAYAADKTRTAAAHPHPGTGPATALQCSAATSAHSATATNGPATVADSATATSEPAATAASATATSEPAATVAAAAPATSRSAATTVAAATTRPAATTVAAPATTRPAAAPATSRPAAVFGAN
jgi:hypothetical protein